MLSLHTSLTRRDLVGVMGLAGAIANTPHSVSSAQDSAAAGKLQVSAQFAHKPHIVHLNAAHLCPMSRSVSAALAHSNDFIDSCPSQRNEDFFERERERLRSRLTESIGAQTADDIAIVRNTTEANNLIVSGFPLTKGDEVVLWDENHPSNNVSWDVRARRDGFKVRRVTLSPAAASATHVVAAFAAAVTARTQVLALTHVSNTTGFQLPIAELCTFAREQGIFVHVDGAQTWGVQPLDLFAMGCSSFTGSAHKWLMGPREVGLLYVRSEHVSALWPSIVGLNWGPGAQTVRKGARKFDCFGQRDDAAILAMHAALDFQRAIGAERIQAHNRKWVNAIVAESGRLGVNLSSPVEPPFSSSIVVLKVDEPSRVPIAHALYEKYRITASTRGGIRLSPHVYNDDDDLDRLIEALRSLARDSKAFESNA